MENFEFKRIGDDLFRDDQSIEDIEGMKEKMEESNVFEHEVIDESKIEEGLENDEVAEIEKIMGDKIKQGKFEEVPHPKLN